MLYVFSEAYNLIKNQSSYPMKIKLMLLSFLSVAIMSQSCKKSDNTATTTGTVSGTITVASSGAAIAGARIIVFNANNNSPEGNSFVTGSDGKYSIALAPGSYYLKIYSQGYLNIPALGSAVAFTISVGATVTNNYAMYPSLLVSPGMLSGKVTSSGNAVANVLVTAVNGGNSTIFSSSITDASGNYTIYNLPAGSYNVQGWIAGYNSAATTGVAVVANTETANVNLALTAGATGQVTGTVTFLATSNREVDVELLNPYTLETIPGLSVMTSSYNYGISNVPAGFYISTASFKNDGIVMDPDWIAKNGTPTITVTTSSVIRNFSVTGAVVLVSPTNAMASSIPVATTATPTFSWTAYPSSSDYVVEVMTASGKVIWGGFSSNFTVKNSPYIPSSQTSITYNSDATATEPLRVGNVYRWRIYASKNSVTVPPFTLISMSEDQQGLIIIQ
jgi:hypothetical protein